MTDIIDPPIDTAPFDPFFDVALRYSCFGVKQKITFTEFEDTSYCRSEPLSESFLQFKKSNAYCLHTSGSFPTTDGTMFWCGNAPKASLAGVVPSAFSVQFLSCKTPLTLELQASSRVCFNVPLTSEPIVDTYAPGCRMGKIAPRAAELSRKFCSTRPKVARNILVSTRLRHYCYDPKQTIPLARWLCKNFGYNKIEIINGISNAAKCRETEIIDYTKYKFQRPCSRIAFTTNIPVLNGLKAPYTNGFTCRIYEIIPVSLQGQYLCRVTLRLPLQDRTYTLLKNKFSCRFSVVEMKQAKRFKCGLVNLTNVSALLFGRHWGGRPLENTFKRTSGRMIGKIR